MDAPEARSPGEVFAERLQKARDDKGWSQRRLAEQLTNMGTRTHQTVIAKIEKKERRVSLDEAIAIAAALECSPLALFLPSNPNARVRLTGSVHLRASYVYRWMAGVERLPFFAALDLVPDDADLPLESMPLRSVDGVRISKEEAAKRAAFYASHLPVGRSYAPGVQLLVRLADAYAEAAADENKPAMRRSLRALRAELESQQQALKSTPEEIKDFFERTGGEIFYHPDQETEG